MRINVVLQAEDALKSGVEPWLWSSRRLCSTLAPLSQGPMQLNFRAQKQTNVDTDWRVVLKFMFTAGTWMRSATSNSQNLAGPMIHHWKGVIRRLVLEGKNWDQKLVLLHVIPESKSAKQDLWGCYGSTNRTLCLFAVFTLKFVEDICILLIPCSGRCLWKVGTRPIMYTSLQTVSRVQDFYHLKRTICVCHQVFWDVSGWDKKDPSSPLIRCFARAQGGGRRCCGCSKVSLQPRCMGIDEKVVIRTLIHCDEVRSTINHFEDEVGVI